LNNFNANWIFNPPNLFGMGRNCNRNYNRNTVQPSPNCGSEANTAASDPSHHTNAAESGKYNSCCCKSEPMEQVKEHALPDCPCECRDVGRILRTFKIKKKVEVTDNGKDDF
jgi:hypothetical protein